ncbi:hypothetical protein AAE478_001062 [Parahypoxylon ruwenzoriense]
MKTFNLILAALAPLALAKAPLVNRDVADGIADNYIVVMKDAEPRTLQAHYWQMHTSAQRTKTGKKGVVKTYQVPGFSGYHIECDDATLESIQKDPIVDYVARDARVTVKDFKPRVAPRANPAPPNNWGLGRISHRQPGIAAYVDRFADKSADPTYAYILDTGIRVTHQEFGGRATFGKNFIDGSQNTDDNGHGTHTAATVGGDTVGVDNSTNLIAVKVLDKDSAGTWSGIIAGIDWAVNDAQKQNRVSRSVINMSIGGPKFQALDDCVSRAVSAGMTIVAAASNYGSDACGYSPASAASSITVAAIDEGDSRPSWSNWGACVDVFAPGADIASAWKDGDAAYFTMSGTSMASPHVAGLVTYLMSREGVAGAANVTARVKELATADKVKDARGSPNFIVFNGNRAEL